MIVIPLLDAAKNVLCPPINKLSLFFLNKKSLGNLCLKARKSSFQKLISLQKSKGRNAKRKKFDNRNSFCVLVLIVLLLLIRRADLFRFYLIGCALDSNLCLRQQKKFVFQMNFS